MRSSRRFRSALAQALPERPFEVELWDGAMIPSTTNGGPRFRVGSTRALGHVLRAPGQLGIGRAYVSGALDVDDVDAALDLLDDWQPPALDGTTRTRLAAAALVASGPLSALRAGPVAGAELRPRGRRHSQERDQRSVRHHYDVANAFFALFLDESMTYSCAIFSRGAQTLEEAQRTKLELVCTKLRLEPGQRVLDVGCGWGSFAIHAAREHRVRVTGVTLSQPQAALARERAHAAGVGDRVDIRVMDWRDLAQAPFDAISSIGMVEHVGSANIDAYAARLATLLLPGGRLLNHGIARMRHGESEAGAFSERFVFPGAAPLHLSRIAFAAERAGLAIEHVEGFPEDYAQTLRHWATRLDDRLDEARRLAGEERVRVWRLYLRASRRGFESGFTSVYQVLARRP